MDVKLCQMDFTYATEFNIIIANNKISYCNNIYGNVYNVIYTLSDKFLYTILATHTAHYHISQ